jgi:hypothetical protein
MKIKLDKKYMINELDLPFAAILDEITDISRWSIHHRIVFPYQGRFYQTWYSEGVTEMQDESPWEYDDTVECEEVELKEVKVKRWVVK